MATVQPGFEQVQNPNPGVPRNVDPITGQITPTQGTNAKKAQKELAAAVAQAELTQLNSLGQAPFTGLSRSDLNLPDQIIPGASPLQEQAFAGAGSLQGLGQFSPELSQVGPNSFAPQLDPFQFNQQNVLSGDLNMLNRGALGGLLGGTGPASQSAFQFDAGLQQQFFKESIERPLLQRLQNEIIPDIATQFLPGGQTGAGQSFAQQAIRQTGRDIGALELAALREDQQLAAGFQNDALQRILSGQLGASGQVTNLAQLGLGQQQLAFAASQEKVRSQLGQQQLTTGNQLAGTQAQLAQQGLLGQQAFQNLQAQLAALQAQGQLGGLQRSIGAQQSQEELALGLIGTPFFDPRLGLLGGLSGNPTLVEQGGAGIGALGQLGATLTGIGGQ